LFITEKFSCVVSSFPSLWSYLTKYHILNYSRILNYDVTMRVVWDCDSEVVC